jgi:pimeloyl-ACP methyl ester carboxylesterase
MAAPHETRRVARTINLGNTRSLPAAIPALPQGNDLVELDLGDDISLFTDGDSLGAQLDGDAATRSSLDCVRLKTRLPAQRGVGDLVIRALKVLDVDLGDWLGPVKGMAKDLIAEEVSRRIDARAVKGRSALGLWQCDKDGPYGGLGFDTSGRKPALVMMHGFFSNAAGSFSGFWNTAGNATLELLRKHYHGSIYAFDHATLGESPVRNALRLAQALGDAQELHLLGYSRGCLVGELLSRAQAPDGFGDGELRRFEATHASDAAELRELRRVVQDKRIVVSRFVRVAGPLRGTWLASNRLDRWLSILYNVARHALPDGAQQIADHVFDLIAAVIKERLERKHFAGIEAMRPDGALMALLNDAAPQLDQRLTVIGGDCVGHGLLNRLKILVTDGFFGEPHDLVVPTASMFGGAPRKGGLRYFFHKTERVDHFHYFRNAESLQRVQVGLIAEDAEYQRLQRLEHLSARPVLTANRAVRPDAPLDVVLPGIMGSGLAYNQNDRLWVDFGEFAVGNFARLTLSAEEQTAAYPSPGTAAIYPYESLDFWPVNFYGHLLEALSRRGDRVIAQGYDWRKPLELAADALAKRLEEEWPDDSPRPLRFIAHSMGGLVVRMLFARHPALRERFTRSARNRVLMLGTPNRGSLAVARTLLGKNDLIDKLDCLAPQNKTELLSVAGTFPGFFELLPQAGLDWASRNTWTTLFNQHNVKAALRPALDDKALTLGGRGRTSLQNALASLPKSQCIYVAGFVPVTDPDATIVDLDADGQYVLGPGDGTVSYASGLIDGVETYYVDAAHGDLPAHKRAFEAYFELLDAGRTTRLARRWQDLKSSRSGVPLTLLQADELPYRPSRAEIVRALLGMRGRGEDEPEPSRPIALRVVHGGLRFARHPIVVGHYHGDTMRNSEAELDQLYGGQLRTALDLGVYPGAVESFEIFKRKQVTADRRSPYAIVVGLGRTGELSVGELRRTVRRGLLGWFGTMLSDLKPEQRESSFSLVLLGSSVSGMTVTECLRAILQGAQDAQKVLLSRPAPEDPADVAPRIRELEIIEIYEDKALELASELPRLIESTEFQHRFLAPLQALESRDDSLTRLRDGSRSVSAVRRLDIRALSGGRLRYALPGIQAAVPLYKRNIDTEEVRTYAREIDQRQSTDPTLGRVLFQQLLPLNLKRFALEQYDLLLTLNESAASLPWELADAGGDLPLAVRAGMVRQLRRRNYTARERVSQDTALVVGRWDVPGLAFLPGAEHEAEVVAQTLRLAGFDVTYLPNADALAIRDALGRKPYRIVHFAGHGVVDYRSPLSDSNTPARTGMVIGSLQVDGAPPSRHLLLLTPEDVSECVDIVPELVFINCCHLGRQTGIASDASRPLDAPKLASNLANVFMEIGCRAVVAAGWAVDDAAAQSFAQEFYEALVGRGLAYIDAVRTARALTYRLHGERTTTWGAYQCYGDVRYAAQRSIDAGDPPRFVSASELACWLDTAAVEAMGASPTKTRQIATRIGRQLAEHANLMDEDVCSRAAVNALESVGDNARALELIKGRIRRRESLSPSLWRAHARIALRAGAAFATDYDDAMKRLQNFADIDASADTWFALGTNCRRWFLLRRGHESPEREALKLLVRATFEGLDCVLQALGEEGGLEELSVEHAQKVLGAIIVADSLQIAELSDRLVKHYENRELSYRATAEICRTILGKRDAARAFWDDVDSADLRLLFLASPRETTLATLEAYRDEADKIAADYRVAMAVAATAAQRDSIEVYNRFWYELAGMCLGAGCIGFADPAHVQHWTWLRAAMAAAALPGIPPLPEATASSSSDALVSVPAPMNPHTVVPVLTLSPPNESSTTPTTDRTDEKLPAATGTVAQRQRRKPPSERKTGGASSEGTGAGGPKRR